jgi:hypothetical protein
MDQPCGGTLGVVVDGEVGVGVGLGVALGSDGSLLGWVRIGRVGSLVVDPVDGYWLVGAPGSFSVPAGGDVGDCCVVGADCASAAPGMASAVAAIRAVSFMSNSPDLLKCMKT